MLKPSLLCLALCAGCLTFSFSEVQAQGFSTLKAAGEGVKSGGGDKDGDDKSAGSGGSGGKTAGDRRRAGKDDYLFLGVFETYNPAKRANARLSIYGSPAEFKYADRTCQRLRQVRDRINRVLFKRPPSVDSKGRVDPTGVDRNVRLAVQNAMKTKREYFTTFYVVNGRFSHKNLPKELEGKPISNCEAVREKAKELAKEK